MASADDAGMLSVLGSILDSEVDSGENPEIIHWFILIHSLIGSMIDSLIDSVIDSLKDSLIGSLFESLIDSLID